MDETGVSQKIKDVPELPFDVSLDYLAFEAEDKPVKVDIKDRNLLRRFEEIDKLSDKDKGAIKDILDTFILKNIF